MTAATTVFGKAIDQAFKARLPLLYIETSEELRVFEEVAAAAAALRRPRELWTWSTTTGLAGPDARPVANTTSAVRALEHALALNANAVFLFHDLHAFLGTEQRPGDPGVVRKIREAAFDFRQSELAKTIVITAPVRAIPAELDKLTSLIEFPLPGRKELSALLSTLIADNSGSGVQVDATEAEREKLVQAALGLTMHEAENAFARAMVDDAKLSLADIDIVLDEKRQAVRKAGLLEFLPSELDLDKVGGLNNLKRWLSRREGAWLDDAEQFGLPSPKGVLITGVPGCGKSLTAKATAASWGLPLLRLDIGRVFAGLVGSSEQNLRTAIATAEAAAPCILWVDEIEKGFSGTSGQQDAGTTARVFGYFLTWMQEKKKPVFVVATANNISALPPEFIRKGRFDEVFFVDLPTMTERRAVWQIQLGIRARQANGLDALGADPATLDHLAAISDNYSGAEIEQAVIAGLYEAFAAARPATRDDLQHAIESMIPLAVTQAETVALIRDWAETRAVSATGSEDADPVAKPAAATPAKAVAPSRRGGRTVDF